MKKYIFALAVALFSSQVYSQVTDDAPAAHSTKTHHVKKPVSGAEKSHLPPPSKVTIGFYTAFSSQNFDMMELYANQGADISCRNCNAEQNSPLHFAVHGGAWGGAMQQTKWLVEHGANVNQANLHGVTPMMMAMERVQSATQMPPQLTQGDENLLSYLIQHGANVQAVDDEGNTPLSYLTPVAGSGGGYAVPPPVAYQQIATLLLETGVNVNQQNKIGETVLMFAASRCAEDSVKFLLASGADARKTNKLKQTALDISIDKATSSGQNSYCNNTVKLLSNPQQISKSFSAQPISTEKSVVAVANYVGTYIGSFSGGVAGPFEATIRPDGSVTFISRKDGTKGDGNVDSDGSVSITTVGNVVVVFAGKIDHAGALNGTWKVEKYQKYGTFKSTKTASADSYAGTYGGSFNGSDEGAFQATINQDGTATLNGHSNKVGVTFTGEGKVNKDGSIEMGSVSTGTTFTGHVGLDGALTGNWENTKYDQAGSFQGTKGVKVDVPTTNPIQAFGGLLGGLVKALGTPQPR